MQRDGKVGRLADSSFLFSGINGGAGGDDLFSDSILDLMNNNEDDESAAPYGEEGAN